ncbi:glutathione S-transferase family protein [Hoeflea sp.]|uniref:glutathione S-transferase family protein n=1 Tax=Hoeflea sp. TaxID=1940281 RepID=UPI0025BF55E7|nr:glutathione S-transferase family protein [Hoeflea sp.]
MLTLYHSGSSVCSQKVRLALAEKGIPWTSRNLDMTKGEHQTPDYLKLNPNGVVPTLVTDTGDVIRESSVIIEYVDALAAPLLMPVRGSAVWQTRLWLIRCIEIHAAINSLTFATVIRKMVLGSMTAEQLEDWLARAPGPDITEKRRDLMNRGAQSPHVDGAVATLDGVFRDMDTALRNGPWLMGDDYSLADCALLAYVDRVRRLGLGGLYEGRFGSIAYWLERSRARPSYGSAIQAYYDDETETKYLAAGSEAWPQIAARLLVRH